MRVLPRRLGLLVAAAIALPTLVAAQSDNQGPLEFRRVYAPADRIEDWPRGNERYVPMNATEFRRLVELVQAGQLNAPFGQSTKIDRAAYTARWTDEGVLVGQAAFDVVHQSPEASLLPLDPCNLAISGANWRTGKTGKALLGHGADGKLRVLVERSGRLLVDWSLRGERLGSGASQFKFDLPLTPLSEMVLDIPKNHFAVADSGLVVPSQGADEGLARWTAELGGRKNLNLRILSEQAAKERRQLTLLRQALTYELSPRGMDVSAQLRVDVHSESLQTIALEMDHPLRLVSARYGEVDIPWSVEEKGSVSHITLEFPEPLSGIGRVIRLSAVGPLKTDVDVRLPGVRAPGLLWQEGIATLLVPSPLVLENLETHECRQSRTSALPAPLAGDSLEVQYYSPTATINAVVARPRDKLQVNATTLVELGPAEAVAESIVRLGSKDAERFLTRAVIQPHWQIRSVEAEGSENVASWEVLSAEGGASRVLSIRLARPISSSREVTLRISARRPLKPKEKLRARDLALLTIENAKVDQELIGAGAVDGYELASSGDDELNRIDWLAGTEQPSTLLRTAPASLRFAMDQTAAALEVWLERTKPSYSADIQIDLAAQEKSVAESYLIRCNPGGQRVERLQVFFSRPQGEPLQWMSAGGSTGRLSARKIAATSKKPKDQEGETWEISLRSPRTSAFEIRGVRQLPMKARHHVALASLPAASSQTGTVTIRALGRVELGIEHAQLKPMAPELLEADRSQTVRGTYRYDPLRDAADPAAVVKLEVRAPAQFSTGAWAWNAHLRSRYSQENISVHQCSYRLQTGAQSRLKVKLPAEAEFRTVLVDGVRLPIALPERDGGIVVNLPSGKGSSTVMVQYVMHGVLPRFTSMVAPPWPHLDVPVLQRRWTLLLPPGYAVADHDLRWVSPTVTTSPWSKRWFGAIGRSTGRRIFNPLQTSSWKRLTGTDSQAQGLVDAFEKSLHGTGAEAEAHKALVTWSDLLASWKRANKDIPNLLVDAAALHQLGILPDASVAESTSVGPLELLSRSGLVLLVHPDGLVMTSAAVAAGYEGAITPLSTEPVFAVRGNALADNLAKAFERKGSASLIPASRWLGQSPNDRTAWQDVAQLPEEPLDAQAWTPFEVDSSGTAPLGVHIVQRSAWWSISWSMFLVGLSIGLWISPRRVTTWLTVCCAMAVVLLFIPSSLTLPASAICLGMLAAMVILMVRRPVPAVKPTQAPLERSSSLHFARAATATALALAASALAWNVVGAAEPFSRNPVFRAAGAPAGGDAIAAPEEGDSSAIGGQQVAGSKVPRPNSVVHRVFVPVDDQLRIQGDKYHVPEVLHNELYRREASLRRQPHGWLLTQAGYRGMLSRESVEKKVVLSELKATFDFQVFRANTRVRIPLGRKGLIVPARGVRLEGQVVRLQWEPAGNAFWVTAMEPGFYRLELLLQPTIQSSPGSMGFDIDIPAVAASRLELTVPADGPSVELPSASGRMVYDKQQGKVSADLGASSRLSVRWHEGTHILESALGTEVEELIWLKVQPGSFVVEAKIKARATEGRVRRLRLLVDPRLQLLPPSSTDSSISGIRVVGADPQILELQLHPTTADQTTVNLTFLMSGTSGVGKIRPPQLETLETRLLRRWIGVSVDGSLQFTDRATADMQAVAAPDFAAAWQSIDSRPQLAYSVPRGELAWDLSTQAPDPSTVAEQTLTLAAGPEWIDVRSDTDLVTESGYHFQLRVAAPPALDIESISLLENGVQRVSRWSRDKAGVTTVFLTAPISGPERLSLRGRLSTAAQATVALPDIHLVGAKKQQNRLRIFRRPSVLLEIAHGSQVSPIELPVDEHERAELGNLIGAYRIPGPTSAVSLKITPNRPQARAVQLISLERKGDDWIAEVDCQLKVSRGVFDSLRFDLPTYWVEPFETNGQAVLQTAYLPDRNRRQLIVRPTSPIHDRYRIKIRGRVLVATGERLKVPDVALRGMSELERFVVLPTQVELQEVAWETNGLKPAKLPTAFENLPISPESFIAYRVDGNRFDAGLRPADLTEGSLQVALADNGLSWSADGRYFGMTAFDLIPGGASTCDLTVPPDCRLLHLSVAGLPPLVRQRGDSVWRIELTSADLPQRIVAVFSGTLAEGGWRRRYVRLAVPSIANVNVRRTLWTVHGPPAASDGIATGLAGSTPMQHQIWRLESAAELIEMSNQVARGGADEELVHWRRPWTRRYLILRDQLHQEMEAAGVVDATLQERLNVMDQATAANRLIADSGGASRPKPLPAEIGVLPLLVSPGETGLPVYCGGASQDPSIEVQYPELPTGDLAHRLVAAIGLVGVAGIGSLALGQRPLPRISLRAATIGMGLLWWLFLEPSVLGLALLVSGCVSLVWSHRRRKPGVTAMRRLQV